VDEEKITVNGPLKLAGTIFPRYTGYRTRIKNFVQRQIDLGCCVIT